MEDLTILLYTANRLPEATAARIRGHLLAQVDATGGALAGRYPLISVSQKPIDFGRNICVGDIGVSKYNAYKQILIGALEVETEYVATVDDDTLYDVEHFTHRPPPGEFLYEANYWFCQDGLDYYWRASDAKTRGGMWGCRACTETLCANLTARFECYPSDPWQIDPQLHLFFGEPGYKDGDRTYGRHDRHGTTSSPRPCLVFVHQASMGYKQLIRFYRRYGRPTPENTAAHLTDFGTVAEVRKRFWEEQ